MSAEKPIAIAGLGYVGLPLALHFAHAGVPVIGLDIDALKAEWLNRGVTSDARLYLHDSYSNTPTVGGFAVPANAGRRTVLAEVDPASLVIMNVIGFNASINSSNNAQAVTGCGRGFLCMSGSFNPDVTFGVAALAVHPGF